MEKIVLIILILMSLAAFSAMGLDKRRARLGKWRISEKALFLLALLGGAVGGTLGMLVFRHKTQHWYFKFGFPILAVLQLAACLYFGLFV